MTHSAGSLSVKPPAVKPQVEAPQLDELRQELLRRIIASENKRRVRVEAGAK